LADDSPTARRLGNTQKGGGGGENRGDGLADCAFHESGTGSDVFASSGDGVSGTSDDDSSASDKTGVGQNISLTTRLTRAVSKGTGSWVAWICDV
jgi:hypothetical protein